MFHCFDIPTFFLNYAIFFPFDTILNMIFYNGCYYINFNNLFCRVLLQGADMVLAFGRRYGLVGRNGLGKTTLLRMISWYSNLITILC
jgi:ABC-type multidrug transport system fused ATPase/permease subunit